MKRLLTTLALALSAGVTGCQADRITSSARGLTMEASISDATVGPGETATISYRLRNVGNVPLSIAVGCPTIAAYIEDEDGATVYPRRLVPLRSADVPFEVTR